MRLSTITAGFFSLSALTSAQILAQPSSPEFKVDSFKRESVEELQNIVKRFVIEETIKHHTDKRGLVDTILNFVSDLNLTSILGNIDFESIAGVANSLLETSFAETILDDGLAFVGKTGLVATGIEYVLENNYTRNLAVELGGSVLSYASKVNTTDLWLALDKSNIAYGLIASLLEDDALFPFVGGVGENVIKSGVLSFSNILNLLADAVSKRDLEYLEELDKRAEVHALLNSFTKKDVTEFLERVTKREEFATFLEGLVANAAPSKRGYEHEAFARRSDNVENIQELEDMIKKSVIAKRDNIEDLLVTILSAVERSGIINTTVHSLLTSSSFESSVSGLLISALGDLSGLIKTLTSINYSEFAPVLTSIWQSGLVQNTFSKLMADTTLRSTVISHIGELFSSFNASALLSSFAKRELDPSVFTSIEMRKRFSDI